ncbi:SGNH/GDSL hydrolase family protein [Paenibacillus sp. MBLB2552]|uniref:SGNH/GDSL hydrolase family protein n=1 Tax=Paenibacillus mellifer TaxID=2937794 RepID=A0A9X2BTV8_9BACL|nr:SGNH/GDSL hydrolase family protein [Paenibacillus mellifer]MCK8489875.1 SGNH/GDSL hydrolase family protein [Paenibacillus mellifer]
MIYTALGDSITFGDNASSPRLAYPHLAVTAYQRSNPRTIKGYVLARSGWTSSNLLDAVLWQGSEMIKRSSVVSVWIGGVDLANAAITPLVNGGPFPNMELLLQFRRNLSAILRQIRKTSSARIVCCTQYNPFPSSSIAVEWIGRLNHTTQGIAAAYDAKVAPAHKWFEGKQAELIDGYREGQLEDILGGTLPIHPNDRGHRVIANGLAPYLFPKSKVSSKKK